MTLIVITDLGSYDLSGTSYFIAITYHYNVNVNSTSISLETYGTSTIGPEMHPMIREQLSEGSVTLTEIRCRPFYPKPV